MKLSTLIIATVCLLTISTASFANTGLIRINTAAVRKSIKAANSSSVKFNFLGIAKGKVNVKMYNQPEGTYTVLVVDLQDNILGEKEIKHTENKTLETVDFGKRFNSGTYIVIVLNGENQKVDETTMLLM